MLRAEASCNCGDLQLHRVLHIHGSGPSLLDLEVVAHAEQEQEDQRRGQEVLHDLPDGDAGREHWRADAAAVKAGVRLVDLALRAEADDDQPVLDGEISGLAERGDVRAEAFRGGGAGPERGCVRLGEVEHGERRRQHGPGVERPNHKEVTIYLT